MNKMVVLAQQELDQFKLPEGYSKEDIKVSKIMLEKILKLLKLGFNGRNQMNDLYGSLINTIGKIANIQGYEINIEVTEDYIEEYPSIKTYKNSIYSIVLWKNNMNKTVNDLIEFISKEDSFMPEANEKASYFHNESLVISPKIFVKTK